MRWLLGLLPFVIAAACGGTLADGSDASSDALPATCATNADCPNGGRCAFPDTGGCGAHRQCFPLKACKGGPYCACDGTSMLDDCAGAASKPVAHTGPCDEPPPPPPPDCGPACEVCDITGYSPLPIGQPSSATNACTSGQISAFVTACLSASATQATCGAWQNTDAGACLSCLVTQTSASVWGPIICDSSTCSINTGGCIDLIAGEVLAEQNKGGKGSCGDVYSAYDGCLGYVCGACSDPDMGQCQADAEIGECKTYFDATTQSPQCTSIDAGKSMCSPINDSDWPPFINLFCGSGN